MFAQHLVGVFQTNAVAPRSNQLSTMRVLGASNPFYPRKWQMRLTKLIPKKHLTLMASQSGWSKGFLELVSYIYCTYSMQLLALRMEHFPRCWKLEKVIMLAKPSTTPEYVSFYRPVSLLPVISELFEKILHRWLRKIIIR